MAKGEDKGVEKEPDLEPEMTPEEKQKECVFYVKWGLFFGILLILMLTCLIAIFAL